MVSTCLRAEFGDELTLARKVLDGLAEQMDHVPVPLSLGVVHARWLDLPNFYSALSSTRPRRTHGGGPPPTLIGSARPPDASGGGLDLLQDPDTVRDLLAHSLEVAGRGTERVGEWRLIPRWSDYL
ncbi:MAG: hypothetical protein ACRDS9_16165 [Pseudonocardiaceae bacterium]